MTNAATKERYTFDTSADLLITNTNAYSEALGGDLKDNPRWMHAINHVIPAQHFIDNADYYLGLVGQSLPVTTKRATSNQTMAACYVSVLYGQTTAQTMADKDAEIALLRAENAALRRGEQPAVDERSQPLKDVITEPQHVAGAVEQPERRHVPAPASTVIRCQQCHNEIGPYVEPLTPAGLCAGCEMVRTRECGNDDRSRDGCQNHIKDGYKGLTVWTAEKGYCDWKCLEKGEKEWGGKGGILDDADRFEQLHVCFSCKRNYEIRHGRLIVCGESGFDCRCEFMVCVECATETTR